MIDLIFLPFRMILITIKISFFILWYFIKRFFKYIRRNAYIQLEQVENGIEFEHFIANLLNRSGYQAKVTQASNDYGVDIIATKKRVKYVIQCKFYSTTVGTPSVQEVVAGRAYYDAEVAIVATNNYFTKNAIALADANDVILWDKDVLIKMIKSIKE